MKFCKILFLSLLAISMWVNNVMARSNAPAGQYWNVSALHDCEKGCYCKGGTSDGANGIRVDNACEERWHNGWTTLNNAEIYLCPSPFIESDEGASAVTQCYMNCTVGSSSVTLHNKDIDCEPGKYLKAGQESCTEDCPAGYACAGGSYHTYCNGDIPGREQCSGLNYAVANSSACSPCDGAGQRIFTSGVLNIDCQTCPDGKYALADHSDCADCPVGYKCENGVATMCGILGSENEYQNETGKTTCKMCTGDGKGVTYTPSVVGSLTVQLHTGCETCPNGQYSDSGICKPCELGHYCVNGTKTPCAKGYYAATRSRTSCSPCGTNYTTEGTGSTSASACVFDGIRLKTSSTEIKFPACLSQGDVNTSVIR